MSFFCLNAPFFAFFYRNLTFYSTFSERWIGNRGRDQSETEGASESIELYRFLCQEPGHVGAGPKRD